MNTEHGAAIRARMLKARLDAKLTQEQAGQRLSKVVLRQTISKWEKGHGSPNPREMAELATVYGVSLDWICKGIASMPATGCELVDRLLSAKPVDFEPSKG